MASRLTDAGAKLLTHLNEKLTENGYPDEPSWGYAFTLLAALEYEPQISEKSLAQKALSQLIKQNKTDRNYSWEFVVYAWQRAMKLCGAIEPGIICYGEKGTRMVNWTLLRQLNRLNSNQKKIRAKLIVWAIRKFYTLNDGQILDEFKTRSLQYHAFCLFVIVELYKLLQAGYLKRWLINGVKFSLQNTLEDGVALYIGRGQEQIFGYGALIFACEFVLAKWPDEFNENHSLVLEKIIKHLLSFQRANGSFPLVLNADQPEPEGVNFKEHRPHGWYGYNTLYDYQPFLAYCLIRADKFKKGDSL